VKTDSGALGKHNWKYQRHIEDAVRILRGEDPSDMLGTTRHKVRSFYNNILDPDSPVGDVTIDTHQVAANRMRPHAGKDKEVEEVWDGGKGINDPDSGQRGFYGEHAEAVRRAAKQLGKVPSALQACTWGGVRRLFDNKLGSAKADAEAIWKGPGTPDDKREAIFKHFGGFDKSPGQRGPGRGGHQAERDQASKGVWPRGERRGYRSADLWPWGASLGQRLIPFILEKSVHSILAETAPSWEYSSHHQGLFNAAKSALMQHGADEGTAVAALHRSLVTPANVDAINRSLKYSGIDGKVTMAATGDGGYTDPEGHTSFNPNVKFEYEGHPAGAAALTAAWGDVHGQSSVLNVKNPDGEHVLTPGVRFHLPKGMSRDAVKAMSDDMAKFKDKNGVSLFEGSSLTQHPTGQHLDVTAHYLPHYHPGSTYQDWQQGYDKHHEAILQTLRDHTAALGAMEHIERSTYSHDGSKEQAASAAQRPIGTRAIAGAYSQAAQRQGSGVGEEGERADQGAGGKISAGAFGRAYRRVASTLTYQRDNAMGHARIDAGGVLARHGDQVQKAVARPSGQRQTSRRS